MCEKILERRIIYYIFIMASPKKIIPQESMKDIATKLVHSGFHGDEYGSVMPAIYTTSTHTLDFQSTYVYSRWGNPTRSAFEEAMAEIENGKYAIATACGLAAVATVFHIIPSGSHIIAGDDLYGGTTTYLKDIVPEYQKLEVSQFDVGKPEEVKKLFKENTKLVYIETPTNPTLKVLDIAFFAKLCKSKNCILVVDNTFLSPYFQNPIDLGADIVLHSGTKYIGGHSDLLIGVIVTKDEALYNRMLKVQRLLGTMSNPFDCYLAFRGLKTLKLRMEACQENAIKIAELLKSHPKVEKVLYCGFPDHPGYKIMKKQARGFGAIISFYHKSDLEATKRFCSELKLFCNAVSLGAVESLAHAPVIVTHKSVPADMKKKLGITDNLIRLSVGIEGIEDLKADILKALDKI